MKKFSFLLAILSVSLMFVSSCAQQAGETTTTTTLSSNLVTGVVLVPHSSITALGVKSASAGPRAFVTANDGVSTDFPPSGTTYQAYDPSTELAISGLSGAVSSNGTYSFDTAAAAQSGILPSGNLLIRATYTSGSNTLLVQGIGAPGTTVDMNAGTTMTWNKIAEEKSEVVGNLLENASSLPSGVKSQVIQTINSLSGTLPSAIGTITSGNIPSLIISSNQTAKDQFENMTSYFQTEYSAYNDASAISAINSLLTNLQSNFVSLANQGTYPSGLEMPSGYRDFTFSSLSGAGWNFPSGAKFPYSPNSNYLPSGIGAKISSVSNAVFESGCQLPSYLTGFLPTGAKFNSGFSFPTYFKGSGLIPPYATFGSGISIPSGLYFPSGANFENANSISVPNGVHFDSGFIVPVALSERFESGFTMPSNAAFASNFTMQSWFQYESGLNIPSGVNFTSGCTVPSGVSFASDYTIPTGVTLGSGYVIQSGTNLASGYTMPSGTQFGSGYVVPTGISFASGYTPPSSGVSYTSGFQNPSNWQDQSWYNSWYSGH